jgi:glycosyltransferase involved in cell wall biosynthesis
MSVSDFKALAGKGCPPVLVYFHENQLTYPLAPGESIDFHFGFTDITTALTAECIRFNSHTHFDAFFEQLPQFIKMMPDYRPRWVVANLRAKADVIYPGCNFPLEHRLREHPADQAPLIIWNHRWEFDKNPEMFFEALDAVASQGFDFRLALLGENFQAIPKAFIAARNSLQDRIVCYGYEPSRHRYLDWLAQGTIIISTAVQENFGIAVVEAVRHGCLPLVPGRLAYPEIIPEKFHSDYLYSDQDDLIAKLIKIINNHPALSSHRRELSDAMGTFAWESRIAAYDQTLEYLAGRTG